MNSAYTYPIGTPGQKWGNAERQAWRAQTTIKREYQQEVVPKIQALSHSFNVEQYGALSYDAVRYPLFCLKTRDWQDDKPTILITGGVHGYETSGVHGALKFLATEAKRYETHFNIVAAPCISPWGYETINRWNPNAIDPNRSFYADTPAEESANLMALVATLPNVLMHIDLHETTDTDESEFRPALAARDGIIFEEGSIPDGFYTVGDTANPQPEFQAAIIASVRKVTHIAPADDNGEIIGSEVVQDGVILYPMKKLGLCGGVTDCVYGSTTEVYPDSPKVTAEECNDAQVAAIIGALDYVLEQI
ncbi:M14 family metallocarboxypeptidase [Vibrio fluvialis]|uniref:M14 family metallopeptidase n=1 Tax=Vibrio fluvialis TaxID=676 RepID=UPI001C9D56CC|nr:M14 family metallocarboxypeptidase [Vibrio fluvialis]HDM8033658.1 M14 family metallocarboxypeptidase [Vibrio fluvialis clinical-1]EKO3379674.1 M14 family metallocarboxypeptidase [Vibrio fluvialis]EKO3412356.1 M14 family metallocarboxypeptidase [Vibrio fluvialis]EKO3420742.1 M14 family metallocarboxypeptidase [Vibrio fluvialis]EKO3521684.1 M14 family metallocarboxypeptidase [Vibrio fluvialis]